ncbi:MAG: oligopeptide transporter, OPT family [Candidatus Thermoplasmatota archaeon]
MPREDFKSFIPPDTTIPELTIKAILVGVFLAVVLGAANAYLGLYAGMTVSAVIPGAVVALALMKPFKPTILEVNIATIGASAGECVAAGVIFTIPALIILNAWSSIDYIKTMITALIGGFLGVFWMVPLRRALVVKTDLPFPEGVAVAAVLTTTVSPSHREKRESTGSQYLWIGALLSGLYKFSQLTLNLFKDTIEGVIRLGKYAISGEERTGYLYYGITASPALLGVGWIIGLRVASYILIGGVLGWVIITPLLVFTGGLPVTSVSYADIGLVIGGFYTIWADQVRYIGVGAMLIGGLYAVYSIRKNLFDSIKEAVTGIRSDGRISKNRSRVDQDINYKIIFILITLMIIPIFLLYYWLSSTLSVSLLMSFLTILLAFIASALAGYLTGLVGSSNCPISGVTIVVLLLVSVVLYLLGVTGLAGMGIVILISAVICIGGSISGDLLQAMASGHMLGATPKRLELSMIFGVLAISLTVGFILHLLHQAFTIGSKNLPAPQAFLMAGIVKGVLGGEMVWPFVIVGMVLALVLILIDLPVLPVAIGIYLPLPLSTPIFIGGIIRSLTDHITKKRYGCSEEEISDWELAIKQKDVKPKERIIRTGLLFTAGLITGEALMGVLSAILVIAGVELSLLSAASWWPGLLLWFYIVILLLYIPLREYLE